MSDLGNGALMRGADEKRRDFRLMCFAASLALLVLLASPWLTIWNDGQTKPPQIYSGVNLLDLLSVGSPPLGGLGAWLVRAYLLFALVCLVFPATVAAVAGSCAGFAATVYLIIVKPGSFPASSGTGVEHIDWTGAPTVAVGIWLVAACVSMAGWSIQPARAIEEAE